MTGTIGAVAGSGDISDAVVRPGVEWAIEFIRTHRQTDPGFRYPSKLRQFLGKANLTATDVRIIRRLIDHDEAFRTLEAASISHEANPVVRLWIERPDGWEAALHEIAAEDERRHEAERGANEAARERRRREAAETRARTAEAARDDAVARLDGVESQLAQAQQRQGELERELGDVRAELTETRNELRHERDRLAAARQRLEDAAEGERDAANAVERAEQLRDEAMRDRSLTVAESADLHEVLEQARRLAERIIEISPGPERRTRAPLSVPGRYAGDPIGAARHLVGTGATVIVDGYNVAKRWRPDADLRTQRDVLIAAAEVMVTRHGADVVVVFDGDEVVGSHRSGRSPIRVMWSPRGTTADDVIRAEVQRLPLSRALVVVTDDRAIIDDVRAAGANHVSSATFIGLLEG